MRKFLLAGFLILVFISAALAEDKLLLIDDFEGPIVGGHDGTVDFGTGNGSTLAVTAVAEPVHSGKQALKAEFEALAGGYMWIARGEGVDAKNAHWLVKPEDINWNEYKAISFWMYGAGSKAQIALEVKDSGGEIWRFISTDNFKGWKQTTCLFSLFAPRNDWQPDTSDKNGELNFPIKSYDFEPLPESKGVLYFDEVVLIKK